MDSLKQLWTSLGRFIPSLLGVLLVASPLIVFLIIEQCNHEKRLKELTNAIGRPEETLWRSKDSLLHAKANTIITASPKAFIKLESSDRRIKELQAEVAKYKKQLANGGSVIVKVADTVKVIVKTPTIENEANSLSPIYKSSFNLKGWVYGTSVARQDSTLLDLKIKNDYTILVVPTKSGFFRSIPGYVEVINKNPYVDNTSLSSYRVALPKPKRFGLGVSAGYGIGSNGLTPYIGLGINYNLINF